MLKVAPVNQHDSVLVPEGLENFAASMERVGIDLKDVPITFDSGFDSQENRDKVKERRMVPVIYPNRRNTKTPIRIAQKFRWFKRKIYKERYKIERSFSWEDVYRRLALSYDRLPETRLGFRHLAYAMVNFRTTFEDSS